MATITLRPRIKKSGNYYKLGLYALAPYHCDFSYAEWKDLRDMGHEILIDMDTLKRQKNFGKMKVDEKELYLRLLRIWEQETGDIGFLNRIIRNGGFSDYILLLEKESI